MTLSGQRQASRPALPGSQRRGSARAGGHLRLLTGGSPASSESKPERRPGRWAEPPGVTWTVLGREEWALTLLPRGVGVDTPALVAGLVRSLQPYSLHSAPGRKAAIVRVPAGTLDPRLGLAVAHHRRGGPVVYCDAGQITATAADTLATLAVHVVEFAVLTRGRGAFQISLVRVRHRDLPGAAHPVVVDVIRGREVTGYVCARVITAGLAEVLGVLGTAYAWHRVRAQVSGAGGAGGF
jgi:hypothetical protein